MEFIRGFLHVRKFRLKIKQIQIRVSDKKAINDSEIFRDVTPTRWKRTRHFAAFDPAKG